MDLIMYSVLMTSQKRSIAQRRTQEGYGWTDGRAAARGKQVLLFYAGALAFFCALPAS